MAIKEREATRKESSALRQTLFTTGCLEAEEQAKGTHLEKSETMMREREGKPKDRAPRGQGVGWGRGRGKDEGLSPLLKSNHKRIKKHAARWAAPRFLGVLTGTDLTG